eukprot:2071871-Pleurochrysis_carterae.AAC.2
MYIQRPTQLAYGVRRYASTRRQQANNLSFEGQRRHIMAQTMSTISWDSGEFLLGTSAAGFIATDIPWYQLLCSIYKAKRFLPDGVARRTRRKSAGRRQAAQWHPDR